MALKQYDIIIIGAGAAGLMSAMIASKRHRKVLILEHTNKVAQKIRISGGGRCNFTNQLIGPNNYLSDNIHYHKSALCQYNQFDFIKLVKSYNIDYHQKTLGQLFCNESSQQIIDMLVNECIKYQVKIETSVEVTKINKVDEKFNIKTNKDDLACDSLIVATGGLSIPKLGASGFGYQIAKQFNHNIIQTYPALVPLILDQEDKDLRNFQQLRGISIDVCIKHLKQQFRENMLFTHRGLSGPAILQISSYILNPKLKDKQLTIDLLPNSNLLAILMANKSELGNKIQLNNLLKQFLPKKFIDLIDHQKIFNNKISDFKNINLVNIATSLHSLVIKIKDNEGYQKAEVTAGGVDTKQLSSKNMESKLVKNLFFIGEVVDVTGWLGGYNFQWAWSSGYVAGLHA